MEGLFGTSELVLWEAVLHRVGVLEDTHEFQGSRESAWWSELLQVRQNDPLEGRGELVEEKGGTAQTEGKDHIKEIQALSLHP